MNVKKVKMTNVMLIVTATATALIAGLMYGYSCSVNLGLGKLVDIEYLGAMQSISKEIQNPIFFLTFFGTMILLPLSTYLEYRQVDLIAFQLLLSATCIYAVGVFGVTAFGNVPLNELLERFDLNSASVKEIAQLRRQFELPWNKFHSIRTLASIVSLVLVIIACVKKSSHHLS